VKLIFNHLFVSFKHRCVGVWRVLGRGLRRGRLSQVSPLAFSVTALSVAKRGGRGLANLCGVGNARRVEPDKNFTKRGSQALYTHEITRSDHAPLLCESHDRERTASFRDDDFRYAFHDAFGVDLPGPGCVDFEKKNPPQGAGEVGAGVGPHFRESDRVADDTAPCAACEEVLA